MGKIVAIGGGEMQLNETLPIDKYIVQFSEVLNPKVLFIPTASGDSQKYIETFKRVYSQKLGCEVNTLLLVNSNISANEIQKKILSSDIIYVGGGNTAKMMDIWKEKNVDTYLKKAYKNNIVLSGLSAGSICWFQKGYSDSDLFNDSGSTWNYTQVCGIGLISAIHCPHYNETERKKFDKVMETEDISGLAIENNCAIVIKDDTYKIIRSDNNSKAYLLKNHCGTVYKKELNTDKFTPVSEIF